MPDLHSIYELFDKALGLSSEARDLGAFQMALRAALVYIVVLAITRSGHKRFLGKGTAFDVIVGILLGSVASRAITGNAPLFPSLIACAVLVGLHALLAWWAFRAPLLSKLVEGTATPLVRGGAPLETAMRDADVTREDLAEALRMRGIADTAKIQQAHLERNGKISVIEKE